MGGLLDAMSFLGGVGERAREYDVEENKRAQKIAELKAKRTDELLKTKWTSAKEKRDAHEKKNNDAIDAGVDSISGQMILKGIDTSDEYWKIRNAEGDSYTHATLFELGETPTITYADEDALYKKELKNQGTTAGRIFESLGGPKRDEVTNVPTDIESGSTSTYRRGKSIANTAQQTTKMDSWKNVDADEKEWQFKWRTYQTDYTDAVEKYKDSPKSEEAKQVFSQLTQDRRTLLYGKGEGKTDWQRKYNLHLLDRPKSDDFVTDKDFDLQMKKWKHGYNILKLGANYDDKTKSGKDQIISLWNDEGIQVKVMRTDNPDDMFDGMPGWRQFGGAEKDKTTSTAVTAGTIKTVNFEGKDQKIIYTGSSEDVFDGMKGWRTIGSTKDISAQKTPNLQLTYNAQGEKVNIVWTGNTKDVFEGKPGWQQVGGAEPAKELSVAEQKWAPIQIIVDAIQEGRTVTQAQLDAAEFITRMTKDAIPQKYHEVLDTWNLSTLTVRDLSSTHSFSLNGKSVPATTENIKLKAQEIGISPQDLKKNLYNLKKK
jgi:hypothetical protein